MQMDHPLSARFREFAEAECKDSSPLYYALSQSIAGDDSILAIAGRSAPGQPVPNLLFAAVHHLLLAGVEHPLAGFYASLNPVPLAPADAFPHFKDFVRSHREEIVFLLGSRLVQTNEVRRSAYLFPALSFAASHFESRPLALIEIGTSAGLNLLWDKYRYTYGDGIAYGDLSSPVHVASSFRGTPPSILSTPLPKISNRIGLDLNIVDSTNPDQAAWLRALIWPEHLERRRLMDAALKRRNEFKLDLRAGDGFGMLAGLEHEISMESLLCVYHTHVANQISHEAREAFLGTIAEIGGRRDIIHVFNNIKPHLHLTAYRGGRLIIDAPLADTDGHARWIEWMHTHRRESDL